MYTYKYIDRYRKHTRVKRYLMYVRNKKNVVILFSKIFSFPYSTIVSFQVSNCASPSIFLTKKHY